MKKSMVTIWLWCLALLGLLFNHAQAQSPSGGKIPIGERPPIDYTHLTTEDFEPGVLYVKFKAEAEGLFSSMLLQSERNQTIALGVKALDDLHQTYGVKEYRSVVYELYRDRNQNPEQVAKHKAWGFHLWFTLSFEAQDQVLNLVSALQALDLVEMAEPVFRKQPIHPLDIRPLDPKEWEAQDRMSPNDNHYGLQWGFKNTGQTIGGSPGLAGADIKAEQAWEVVTGNPAVIVAVIDDGIQFTHPDLSQNIWPGIGPGGNSTIPGNHGTHVAGTVAASTNNGMGVAGTAGGNGNGGSGVKVMSLDIFNPTHGLNNLQLNIYAADNGAAISQNSWGYTKSGVYNNIDLQGIDYFNANGGGSVMDGGITIFAAGNSNSSANWYPAFYSGAMAVASTTNQDKKSSFSNFGSWIDLAAPGSDIASTITNNGYAYMSGTSMACPHVSGVAALLLSYSPGTLTNQQLWNYLVDYTDNINSLNPSHSGLLGSGRLNAWASLEALMEDQGNSYTITVTSGPHGSISPSGTVNVPEGGNQTFAIQAEAGFVVEEVWVDGNSIGAVSSHTFNQVMQDHTLHATFTTAPQIILTASASEGGAISPSGQVSVTQGLNQTFVLSPHPGYVVGNLWIDEQAQGPLSSYTFTSVQQTHTIYAEFVPNPCYVTQLPYSESFNPSGIPNCWSSQSLQGGLHWQQGSFNGGLSGNNSYLYARATGNNAQTAELISPNFNFSQHSGIEVQFIHYYQHFRSSAAFSYSTDGGNQWIPVQTWTSSTSNPSTFNQSLSALSGQSNVLFKWTFLFEGGGSPNSGKSWSIDNFQISANGEPQSFTLTATSGIGGTVSPSGTLTLVEGSSQTFLIQPLSGYQVQDLVVDGQSLGALTQYTFSNINSDHTLHASFSLVEEEITHTLTATSGTGGTVSPSGILTLVEGSNQTFVIQASPGFEIEDVVVDGQSQGALTQYTFSNINSDHTLHASFAAVEQEEPEECVLTDLPYLQDFNQSNLPECWESEILSGSGNGWQVGTFSGGLSGSGGNYAFCNIAGNSLQVAALYSPTFDFTYYNAVQISFNHYYRHFRSSAEFSYSTDGGNSWTLLQTWTSTSSNPSTYTQSPAGLAGQSSVIFRWVFDFTGGGSPNTPKSWSVDNFQVTGTSLQQFASGEGITIPRVKPNLNFEIYPNPAYEKIHLKFDQDQAQVKIHILDGTGRILREIQWFSIERDTHYPISIENLPGGVLYLMLDNGSEKNTQKVIHLP
jgi:hypothetical protein